MNKPIFLTLVENLHDESPRESDLILDADRIGLVREDNCAPYYSAINYWYPNNENEIIYAKEPVLIILNRIKQCKG